MALDEARMADVAQTVGRAATVREAAGLLRAQLQGIKALVVDAMDMRDETPALRVGARSIYLASTDGHCWTVTADLAQASALILAED